MGTHLTKLLERHGLARALDTIVHRMKRHELITLLMEAHAQRAQGVTPGDLMGQYAEDRFVIPSPVSQRTFNHVDAVAFHVAGAFEAVELSPIAPLGACSAVAPVDPKSTGRMQEVVSDCTNVLAAVAAQKRRRLIQAGDKTAVVRLCTSHRHTRMQSFGNPLFSAHFRVFALVNVLFLGIFTMLSATHFIYPPTILLGATLLIFVISASAKAKGKEVRQKIKEEG